MIKTSSEDSNQNKEPLGGPKFVILKKKNKLIKICLINKVLQNT